MQPTEEKGKTTKDESLDNLTASDSSKRRELERGFAERLKASIGDENQAAFARKCGISEGALRKYAKGALPGLEILVEIARTAGVSVHWLATGEGPKHLPAEKADLEDLWVRHAVFGDEDAAGKLKQIKEEQSRYLREPEPGEFRFVYPVKVSAAAGHGCEVEAELPGPRLAFRSDWLRAEGIDPARLAVIRVKGDSMEPTLADGDSIAVDLGDRDPSRPGIFVLRVDTGLVVKRLQLDLQGRIVARSDNPAYGELVGNPADVHMVGRVVWAGRRF